MEEGQLHYEERGTPQGGVVSPLLSNIYLHEVFDQWFAEVVQERMRGQVFAVRFADDLLIGFTPKRWCGNWTGTTPITGSPEMRGVWRKCAPKRRSCGSNGCGDVVGNPVDRRGRG